MNIRAQMRRFVAAVLTVTLTLVGMPTVAMAAGQWIMLPTFDQVQHIDGHIYEDKYEENWAYGEVGLFWYIEWADADSSKIAKFAVVEPKDDHYVVVDSKSDGYNEVSCHDLINFSSTGAIVPIMDGDDSEPEYPAFDFGTEINADGTPYGSVVDDSTGSTATGVTTVTLTQETLVEGEGNIKVTVPTSLPLAVDSEKRIVGPSTSGFTNIGTRAVSVSKVEATLGAGFAAAPSATGATADNAVYLKIVRAQDPTSEGSSFTLAQAVEGKTLTGWTLPANMGTADTVAVSSDSNIANQATDLTTARTLATLRWTLTAA